MKLPFAKNHIIVTKLFLKNSVGADATDVFLPEDVLGMLG